MNPLDLSYCHEEPVSHNDRHEVYFSQVSFCFPVTLSSSFLPASNDWQGFSFYKGVVLRYLQWSLFPIPSTFFFQVVKLQGLLTINMRTDFSSLLCL